jgi:hypothetical protein
LTILFGNEDSRSQTNLSSRPVRVVERTPTKFQPSSHLDFAVKSGSRNS